jgi:hypothetical protein
MKWKKNGFTEAIGGNGTEQIKAAYCWWLVNTRSLH